MDRRVRQTDLELNTDSKINRDVHKERDTEMEEIDWERMGKKDRDRKWLKVKEIKTRDELIYDRSRERNRPTEIQIDRWTDRQTDRQTDKKALRKRNAVIVFTLYPLSMI